MGAAGTAAVAERSQAEQTKVCPRCGMELFTDMDVCYGCLYDFTRVRASPGMDAGAMFSQPWDDIDEPDVRVEGADPLGDMGALDTEEMTSYPFPAAPEDECAPKGRPCLAPQVAGPAPAPVARTTSTAPAGLAPAVWDGDADGDDDPTMDLANLPWEEIHGSRPQAGQGGSSGVDAPEGMCLQVLGHDMEVMVPLLEAGLVIGRSHDCDLVLHARSVSRRHVRVTPVLGGAVVENLGATNPTMVRGREVRSRVNIRVGEMVDVCGTRLVLCRAGGQ